MAFFSGYLALGSGSTTFTELSGNGYARKAITIDTLNLPNNLTNTSAVVYAATGTWLSATQFGLYDASSAGNLVAWWRKTDPFKLTNGQKHVVDTDTLRMVLQVPNGMYDAGVTLGVMKQTNASIISGNVTIFGGVLAAFTFGPTGPTGVTGPTGPSVTGPTGATGAGAAVATPSLATSTGTAGTWSYDATHIYVCVATNTWVRATLATF